MEIRYIEALRSSHNVPSAASLAIWVATLAGWYVTEIGRQPFIVHGLVRTADVASSVPAPMIALTLTLYVTVYLALIVAYVAVIKYMAEKPEAALESAARAETQGLHPAQVAEGDAA